LRQDGCRAHWIDSLLIHRIIRLSKLYQGERCGLRKSFLLEGSTCMIRLPQRLNLWHSLARRSQAESLWSTRYESLL
jgi:hypothetical protein